MQISEVEKLTGIKEKVILLYEKENLITINHIDNSSDYSDDNIKQLLEIKLFQKFGIKISELKKWKTGEIKSQDLLSDCLSSFERKEKNNSDKMNLCKKILRDIKAGKEVDSEAYLEIFEFYESDEYDQLEKSIENLNRTSLLSQFFFSLILLGPIGWLFLNYYGLKDYNALSINIPFACLSIIILTISWTLFLRKRICNIKNILKGTGKFFLYLILFLLLIFFVFSVLILIGFFAELFFIPNDYLFYTMNSNVWVAFIICLVEFALIFLLIVDLIKKKNFIKPFIKKFWYILIPLNLISFYFIATSLFIVTPNKIINYSLLNPNGKSYTYFDITTINTGFDQGQLYYKIEMNDGKNLDLINFEGMSSSIDSDDEYYYLTKIDELAVNTGAIKIISQEDIPESYDNNSSVQEIFANK